MAESSKRKWNVICNGVFSTPQMRRVMKIEKDIEHVDPYVKDFDRRFRAMGSSGVREKIT